MKRLKNNKGLTILEIMISLLILVPLFAGVMITFVKCIEFNDVSSNTSEATLAVRNKLVEIENTAFANVVGTFNNATFTVAALDGIGVTYVDSSVANILTVKTVFCWQEKNGRVIGEDKNLNGQLDGGEDANGNGELDSTVQFTTVLR